MRGQCEPSSQHEQAGNQTFLTWRRFFPGEPVQLRTTRKWLEDLLPPCTARGDVIAVASELATNAVRHTASGRGGQFSVEVTWSAETVRLTVGDGGSPTGPVITEEPDEEHGRGLLLVRALSQAIDVSGDAGGRLVAATLPWAANGGPAPDFRHETYAGIASLQARSLRFQDAQKYGCAEGYAAAEPDWMPRCGGGAAAGHGDHRPGPAGAVRPYPVHAAG
jgi:serine/threonine-protein kinase RsbW